MTRTNTSCEANSSLVTDMHILKSGIRTKVLASAPQQSPQGAQLPPPLRTASLHSPPSFPPPSLPAEGHCPAPSPGSAGSAAQSSAGNAGRAGPTPEEHSTPRDLQNPQTITAQPSHQHAQVRAPVTLTFMSTKDFATRQ